MHTIKRFIFGVPLIGRYLWHLIGYCSSFIFTMFLFLLIDCCCSCHFDHSYFVLFVYCLFLSALASKFGINKQSTISGRTTFMLYVHTYVVRICFTISNTNYYLLMLFAESLQDPTVCDISTMLQCTHIVHKTR